MKALLSDISQSVLNIVYPIYCQGCGIKLAYNNKLYLCGGCLKNIKFNSPPFCIRCGRTLKNFDNIETVCPSCVGKKFYFDRAWQSCEYDGLTKDLIHNFKYGKKIFLTDLFAYLLCDFIKVNIDYKGIDLITSVPMSKKGLSKRGFNQASLIAEGVSKVLHIAFSKNMLKKTKDTKQQVNLKKEERFINIKDAFSAVETADIKGKKILLVDDVFTTGATADECSKVLKKAGA